jgi:hypothetical protein
MNEEASAGEEVIQGSPTGLLKGRADSKDSVNIWFSARPDLWKNHCLMVLRECPPSWIITQFQGKEI